MPAAEHFLKAAVQQVKDEKGGRFLRVGMSGWESALKLGSATLLFKALCDYMQLQLSLSSWVGALRHPPKSKSS
jgi:hypothetical protein